MVVSGTRGCASRVTHTYTRREGTTGEPSRVGGISKGKAPREPARGSRVKNREMESEIWII